MRTRSVGCWTVRAAALCAVVAMTVAPRTGRAGYVDGMSLYEYAKSSPAIYPDPLGSRIVCTCDITKYLKSKGVEATEDPWAANIGHTYTDAHGGKGIESVILVAMIKSKYSFRIKGSKYSDEVKNLQLNVSVRKAIVKRAKDPRVAKWGFGSRYRVDGSNAGDKKGPWKSTTVDTRVGQTIVHVADFVPRKSAYSAVNDTYANPSSYAFGCLAAQSAVVTAGVADVLKKDYNKELKQKLLGPPDLENQENAFAACVLDESGKRFAFGPDDWIPGDLGYVPNPASTEGRPTSSAQAGEHVIFLGLDPATHEKRFYAHGLSGVNPAKGITWKQLQIRIAKWSNTDPKKVVADTDRYMPTIGLQSSSK